MFFKGHFLDDARMVNKINEEFTVNVFLNIGNYSKHTERKPFGRVSKCLFNVCIIFVFLRFAIAKQHVFLYR